MDRLKNNLHWEIVSILDQDKPKSARKSISIKPPHRDLFIVQPFYFLPSPSLSHNPTSPEGVFASVEGLLGRAILEKSQNID